MNVRAKGIDELQLLNLHSLYGCSKRRRRRHRCARAQCGNVNPRHTRAAALIERGALDPSILYLHSFVIDEVSEAFKLSERCPEGFLKGWIRTAV